MYATSERKREREECGRGEGGREEGMVQNETLINLRID